MFPCYDDRQEGFPPSFGLYVTTPTLAFQLKFFLLKISTVAISLVIIQWWLQNDFSIHKVINGRWTRPRRNPLITWFKEATSKTKQKLSNSFFPSSSFSSYPSFRQGSFGRIGRMQCAILWMWIWMWKLGSQTLHLSFCGLSFVLHEKNPWPAPKIIVCCNFES